MKQYVQERGSSEVQDLIQAAEHAGTSQITRTEMAAALARATRMRLIPVTEGESAWNGFLKDWGAITRLKVSGQIIEQSGNLAWKYPLRGYDALHLASAILWQEILEAQIILATFDRELWLAGSHAGLIVWPENLPHK